MNLAAWYRRAARKLAGQLVDSRTLQVDREAVVSFEPKRDPRKGAWVKAWLWVEGPDVPDEERTEIL